MRPLTDLATLTILVLIAAACAPQGTSEGGPTAEREPTAGGTAATDGEAVAEDCEPFGPSEAVPPAPHDESAQFPWEREDPAVAEDFDRDRIISGGPPPDGIPSIDEPCFEPIAAGDRWLEGRSPVMTVEVDGDARAYPLAIMSQHEIVNDVVGDEPLVVTYCPLCNSGLAFDRTVEGQVLDFGTSGRLFQANLVMYDRQTKALWIQFTGRAVVGEPWVGTELERRSTALLSWEEFKESSRDGVVLSRDTGHDRSYGTNPYQGYEDRGSSFLFDGPTDDRLPPNSRVVGLTGPDDGDPVAVALAHLRQQRTVDVDVAGDPIVVFWAPGKASALDTSDIDEGRDVGQTGSFRPTGPEGRQLTFQASEEDEKRFVDEQTGSTWTVAGKAVAGPLEGAALEEVPRDDTFWFVWFAFRPQTEVVGAEAAGDG